MCGNPHSLSLLLHESESAVLEVGIEELVVGKEL